MDQPNLTQWSDVRAVAEPVADDGPWTGVVELFHRAAEHEDTSVLVGAVGLTVRLRPMERDDVWLIIGAHGALEIIEGADLDAPVDVELRLATADLARLADGRLRTAMAIAGGRATYTGPVRQFLRVLPMVQAIARPPVPVGTNTIHDGVEEIS